MIIHLLKKDFLLIKKSLAIFLILPVLAPLFIKIQVGNELGFIVDFLAFFMTSSLTFVMIHGSISLAESKDGNGFAFLCATPFTRKLLVYDKYLFYLPIFLYCAAVYMIETLLFPSVFNPANIGAVCLVFFILSVVLSVIIPLEYKFGYQKAKNLVMLFMMLSMYVVPASMGYIIKRNIAFGFPSDMPLAAQSLIPIIPALIILACSISISQRIFSAKDL